MTTLLNLKPLIPHGSLIVVFFKSLKYWFSDAERQKPISDSQSMP